MIRDVRGLARLRGRARRLLVVDLCFPPKIVESQIFLIITRTAGKINSFLSLFDLK